MTIFKSSPNLHHPVTITVVRVGDVSYLVSGECYTSFTSSIADDDDLQITASTPVTVINLQNERTIDSSWLEGKIKSFLTMGDVFNEDFLSRVLLKGSSSSQRPSLSDDAKAVLAKWGATGDFIESESNIRSGPHMILASKTLRLCQVFRLYPDPQLAFMYGTVPSEDRQSYQATNLGLIPVPSRLYFDSPSDTLPLSGKRIAVKDVFDLKGTATSAGVRALADFYGVSRTSAPAIQELIAKGAVIVGKTKTVPFASGESPMDWIDYHCPFNPRGDGYFTASGSSTGSAAGLAAYDWLDITIGTDTFGSMIVLASWQGLYAIRPTHGLLDQAGVVPHSQLFDNPGYFSRGIDEFKAFGEAWYALGLLPQQFDVSQELREKNGREPYVDPMIGFKWELGSQLTKANYNKALEERSVFLSFVKEHLVKDDSILVLPMENLRRSIETTTMENGRNMQGYGFGNIAFTVLAGLPAVNVPVGQLPIKSKVTQGIINEPIGVMLVGPSGSDGWLIDIIKETLVSTGRPLGVRTGPDVYTDEDWIS
ncbi:hypothetical protein JMJ35_006591 [Cladonia borealis]|uniref:Amidase n=1 Tax=Cladonia borealis TaxID=184061 RepID=A0AA39QZW5_9LECA|nr:hypothetical protein JMJ35_006591 [Cladonia borealis]